MLLETTRACWFSSTGVYYFRNWIT